MKKTLSIPQWLNEEAVAQNINFSQVLQDGLKARLGLKKMLSSAVKRYFFQTKKPASIEIAGF